MIYITLNKTINSPGDQFPIVVNEYPQLNTDEWDITNVTSTNGTTIINDIDGSTFKLKPRNLKNSNDIINVMMHNDTAVTKRNRDYTLRFNLNITCNYYLPFKLTNTSSMSQVVHIDCSDVYYYVGNENAHPSRSSFTRTDYSSGSTIIVNVPAGKTIFLFSELQKINHKIEFCYWNDEEWRFGGNIMGMLLNNKFEVDDALSEFLGGQRSITTSPELPETNLRTGCYKGLFMSSTKIKTPPSILPSTNVPTKAYKSMFYDCVSLETAPVISARSVGNEGMAEMFYNCAKLVNAPDLSNVDSISDAAFQSMFESCDELLHSFDVSTGITTLPVSSFYKTFNGCKKLTDCPDFSHVTTALDNSMYWMFGGCTALTTPPDLSSLAHVGGNACRYMFRECTSLTTPPDLSNVVDASGGAFGHMFLNCTSLTTAPDISGIVDAAGAVFSSMFQGCTSLTTAPDITGVKSLGLSSCQNMFKGCSRLFNFSGLPDVSDIPTHAYAGMFEGCTSLSTPPDMSHITSADSESMLGMFKNCVQLSTPPNLSNITGARGLAFESMFQGCTSLRTPPDISNVEFTNYANYDPSLKSMFEGCTSLTSTPVLSGTTAVNFENMFKGCTSLIDSSILLSITNFNSDSSFKSMFEGCTSLVTPSAINVTEFKRYSTDGGFEYMFKDCTSLTSIPDMTAIKPLSRSTKNVFKGMFQGCMSLRRVENLPALGLTTIQTVSTGVVPNTDGWFLEMFKNCSNLNEVHNRMTAVSLNDNCKNIFYNWLDGVSPTGTYYYNVNLLGMSYYTGTQAEKEEQIKADYNVPSEWTMVPEVFDYDDTLEFAPGYPAIIDGSLGIVDVGIFVGDGWNNSYIPCPRSVTVTCKDSSNNTVFNNTYTITGYYTSTPYIVRINPIVDVNETKVTVTVVATFGSKTTKPIIYEIQRNTEERFEWSSGYPEPINNSLSSVNLGYYIGDGYNGGDRILKIKFTDPHGVVMYTDSNINISGSYTETPYINNIRPNIYADTNELIIDSSVTFMKDGVPVSSIMSPKTVTVPAPTFDYTVTNGTDHGKYTGRRSGYTSTMVTVHVNLNIANGCSTGNRKLVVKVVPTSSPGTVLLSRTFDNITGNVFEQDVVQTITNTSNMYDVNIVSTVSYYGTYGNLLDTEETTVNSQLIIN